MSPHQELKVEFVCVFLVHERLYICVEKCLDFSPRWLRRCRRNASTDRELIQTRWHTTALTSEWSPCVQVWALKHFFLSLLYDSWSQNSCSSLYRYALRKCGCPPTPPPPINAQKQKNQLVMFCKNTVNCFHVLYCNVSTLQNPPFSLSPVCPEEMDWSELYPDFFSGDTSGKDHPAVEFADIGCGYGGLLGRSNTHLTIRHPHSFSQLWSVLILCPFLFLFSIPSIYPSGVGSTFPRQAHARAGDPSEGVWLCAGPDPVIESLRTGKLPEHCLPPQQRDEIPPQFLL